MNGLNKENENGEEYDGSDNGNGKDEEGVGQRPLKQPHIKYPNNQTNQAQKRN
jgi:hypothetical protein